MNALRPWLQIIRLPNIFTSQSNVLAGLLVASVALPTSTTLLLLAASSCLYAGGVALNDWFDEETDRVERPSRPIPSGRIKKRSVLIFVVFTLPMGILLCWTVSVKTGILGSLLVLCILAYDGLVKNVLLLGPFTMALCRALNWYLGLSQGAPPLNPLFFMLAVFLFVLLIMMFSRYETAGEIPWFCWLCSGMLFACFVLILLHIGRHGRGDNSLLVALLFCVILLVQTLRISFTSPAENIAARIVSFLIVGFIPLDALLVFLVRDWQNALPVLFLLLPCWLSARFFYTT